MGIVDRIKKIANDADALAHADIRGRKEAGAAIKAAKANVTQYVGKKRVERAAKKAAKAEQKYQDFEREHLSETAKIDREIEKSKDEAKEANAERRKLKRDRLSRVMASQTRKAPKGAAERISPFAAGGVSLGIGGGGPDAKVKSAGLGNVGNLLGLNSKKKKGKGVYDFF